MSSSTASRSDTVFHSQNGYEAGNLKSLRIELDGSIRGFYTNGIQRTLGAVALATFENQDGLKKAGRNQFYKTLENPVSRKLVWRKLVHVDRFTLPPLKSRTSKLGSQFVNMIMTQRGFQANSRSITTTDSMIEEVVNLKR